MGMRSDGLAKEVHRLVRLAAHRMRKAFDSLVMRHVGLSRTVLDNFSCAGNDWDVFLPCRIAKNFGDCGTFDGVSRYRRDSHELAFRLAQQIADGERIVDIAAGIGVK